MRLTSLRSPRHGSGFLCLWLLDPLFSYSVGPPKCLEDVVAPSTSAFCVFLIDCLVGHGIIFTWNFFYSSIELWLELELALSSFYSTNFDSNGLDIHTRISIHRRPFAWILLYTVLVPSRLIPLHLPSFSLFSLTTPAIPTSSSSSFKFGVTVHAEPLFLCAFLVLPLSLSCSLYTALSFGFFLDNP